MTETLRFRRLRFEVLETVRGASPVGWRSELHRRAWRRVLDDDLPGAIIIEDGARLMPGFVRFLQSGGYLHADLTQFCYDRARVWRWGGCDASPGVRLRPLAAGAGLSSGYALSQRGARQLLDGAGAAQDPERSRQAVWPRDVARLDTLVSRPRLVAPPDWLADADREVAPAMLHGERDAAAVERPQSAADRLRGLARGPLSRELSRAELSHGF
ncbi:hypothetical protein JHW45_10455 [Paracoccus stylophorae]|uniref:Uncharacterized protein n=1 Tax=Paracoccus stylophorae TaxID=659350 RepID=A0ABY7SR98_9RHOB|nr:hypothetical protein [Paracoccus stylophorae]WCR09541.1 hypothetical protein JHW45_10455 [Paracoccus stylophorae]